MAIPTLRAIGFCAHYSKQGDWAFDYALRLAIMHSLKLNVFHFLTNPYDPNDNFADELSNDERTKLAIEKEKELRLYYDKRAGEYLDVGFRLCEHAEWVELHRCLVVHEFQVLVLGYTEKSVNFGTNPIENFAEKFICPVVLVGPEESNQYFLNSRAALISDKLGIKKENWTLLDQVPSNLKA